MPFGKSPLEALEIMKIPGVILAYKYSQFRQRRREAESRRVTERELNALHHKIEKLLSKLEESELEPPTSQEDECVICISSRATMQTMPCGHKVVCRRCFVKTIQSAVAQRMLPLRCVICRARVNRLTSSSGTWRLQGSASSYSMGSKSWSVPGSASSYSMGAQSYNPRVTQSASLYSMKLESNSLNSMSSGSSFVSGISNISNGSGISRTSSEVSSSSSASESKHHHHHAPHSSCTNGCLGAIPRTSYSHSMPHRSKSQYSRSRVPDISNRLPPIKEFPIRSPSRHRTPSPAANPGARFKSYTSGKIVNSSETAPLLGEHSSSPSTSRAPKLGHKVAPIASKAAIISKTNSSNIKYTSAIPSTSGLTKSYSLTSASSNASKVSASKSSSKPNSAKSSTSNSTKVEEKKDNKKNETLERKKKEEKLRQKAEKEAKKEEKRLAKEEEKLAKLLAKEEKKRNKKDSAKALLVAT